MQHVTTINDQIMQSIKAEQDFAMEVQTLLSEIVIKNTDKEHEHKLDLLKKENQARQDVYNNLHKQKLLHTEEEYEAEKEAAETAETAKYKSWLKTQAEKRKTAIEEAKATAAATGEDPTEAIKQIKKEYETKRTEEFKLYKQRVEQNKQEIDKKQKREEAAAKKAGDEAAKKVAQQAKKDDERQKQKEAREKQQQLIQERKQQAKEDLLYGGVEGWKRAFTNENGTADKSSIVNGLLEVTSVLGDYVKSLNTTIEAVAKTKAAVDTRLQGWNTSNQYLGSYWAQISKDIVGVAAVSPYVKQESIVDTVKEYINKGIAFNVEQRAFLQVVSDKIATTFNAADGTLTKLIRIQQQDSTAARLGMESALNTFLNSMYETSEYLSDLASSIRGSLYEAEALMDTKSAVELEYQVQKWAGSMYSVGMSDSAVSSITSAIGKLAAGDISGINSGTVSNLVIMAANQANLNIADALTKGLDSSNTNKLMQAMVEYLNKIYNSTSNSKLLQQQFASIYGLSASDLKAISNLAPSMDSVYKNTVTYSDDIKQLISMADSMYTRISIGEMASNVFSNFTYSLASGIGSNPVLYAIYKVAGLLDTATGGQAIPAISAFGNMVDLETTIADLLRVTALGGSILQGIATLAGSGGDGGLTGSGMLRALKIVDSNIATVSRGTGENLLGAGRTVSESGGVTVGNANSSDVYNKTLTNASDEGNAQLAEVKESEETDVSRKVVDEHVLAIYNLLRDITNGATSLKVDMGNSSAWGAMIRQNRLY